MFSDFETQVQCDEITDFGFHTLTASEEAEFNAWLEGVEDANDQINEDRGMIPPEEVEYPW
jgi:hypothetical protein